MMNKNSIYEYQKHMLKPIFFENKSSDINNIKNNLNIINSEYSNDISLIILENNILQLINLINDINEDQDLDKNKYIKYNLFGVLQNLIILNNTNLKNIYRKNKFNNIINALYSIDDEYNKKLLLHMIYNIIELKSINNINYRNINPIVSKYPPINIEERISIEKNLPQFRKQNQFKKNPNIFKVDEIVGVKSDENKWNLGRVLHKFIDKSTGYSWYYVKIEGTSDICNFWINSITYRIQKFKPRKHLLYR